MENFNFKESLKLNGSSPVGSGGTFRVAILDSGIQLSHQVFAGSNVQIPDLYPSADQVNDLVGHGTAVASIIAGNPQGDGINGIAQQAIISPFLVLNPDGSTNLAWLRQALEFILDNESKFDVVNMSLNVVKAEYDQIAGLIENLFEKGILITAAAGDGNSLSSRIYYPAFSECIISVGTIKNQHLIKFQENKFYKRVDYFFLNDAVAVPTISTSASNTATGCSMYTGVVTGLIASMLSDGSIDRSNRNVEIRNKLLPLAFDYQSIPALETLTLYKT